MEEFCGCVLACRLRLFVRLRTPRWIADNTLSVGATIELGWAFRSVIEATHGDTVFVAPDGFLHNLPFAALPTRQGRWIESARIVLVESVASVLHTLGEGRALSGATVVTAHRIGDDDRPYAPILAAKDEGTVVAELLRTQPHHLTDAAGAADELRNLLGRSYDVVHIAAHAEVLREPKEKSWAPERAAHLHRLFDPYAQCRIICGGFNAWAKGRYGTPEDVDQVSLSASDLAELNLQQVRLLTLSSCSGAAGDVRPLESSSSLATAARAAGAVVAALWPVPDIDTRDLMIELYWLEPATGSSVEALRQAQMIWPDYGADPTNRLCRKWVAPCPRGAQRGWHRTHSHPSRSGWKAALAPRSTSQKTPAQSMQPPTAAFPPHRGLPTNAAPRPIPASTQREPTNRHGDPWAQLPASPV